MPFEYGSQLWFFPIRIDIIYGLPSGLTHDVLSAVNSLKCFCSSVHEILELYLKSTMWVMGAILKTGGREEDCRVPWCM
jgi:hypothetical protein